TSTGRPPSAGPDVRGAGGRVLSEVAVEDEVEAEGPGLPVDGGEGVAALAEMALALLGVREPQPGPQSRKDLVELGQQLGPGEVDPTVGRGEVLDSGDHHLVIRDAHQAHHSTLPIDHSRSPSQYCLCLAYPKRYRTEGCSDPSVSAEDTAVDFAHNGLLACVVLQNGFPCCIRLLRRGQLDRLIKLAVVRVIAQPVPEEPHSRHIRASGSECMEIAEELSAGRREAFEHTVLVPSGLADDRSEERRVGKGRTSPMQPA